MSVCLSVVTWDIQGVITSIVVSSGMSMDIQGGHLGAHGHTLGFIWDVPGHTRGSSWVSMDIQSVIRVSMDIQGVI